MSKFDSYLSDSCLLDNILIYQWQAWDGFLISHLAADYCHIDAHYDDEISNLEQHLTPNIRAVLFQVNLTNAGVYPAKRLQLIRALQARNILVLNLEVEDISKRNLHQLLQQAGLRSAKAEKYGQANQLLFIKSNLNWGGEIELRLPQELHEKLLPQKPSLITGWDNYYVIKRCDIDPELWFNSSVVIENYIENSENSFFRVYGFGDSIVIVKAHSEALIKKLTEHPKDINIMLSKHQILTEKTELAIDLQETIKTFITHYPLAYFCLDIVHDAFDPIQNTFDSAQNTGAHYIIDLNLTPYAGVKQQTSDAVNFLCQGARSFLKRNLETELQMELVEA